MTGLPPMLPMQFEPEHGLTAELEFRVKSRDPAKIIRLGEILDVAVLAEILHWNTVMWSHTADIPRCIEATAHLSLEAREVLGLAGVHVPSVPLPPRPRPD